MKDKLIIIGASGHGKVVADIAAYTYKKIFFLDDNECIRKCAEYPVIDVTRNVNKYIKNSDIFVAVGNTEIRKRIVEQLEKLETEIPVLIHPQAVIGKRVSIGKGTVVMAGAVINTETVIGKACIVNTCSSVDHDSRISDYVHIAVGAHLAGTVSVGSKTWIGAGAIVSNNVSIASKCMIGAGAVVVKNISDSGVYVGVPAKRIK